ncbi:CinA family protein [Bosea sp. LjRoot237]|uniref:CinA family protein n=1 Tax=Bosea sp. LjRoot237 TaxID=3342292 RepID=UPI003ECF8B89
MKEPVLSWCSRSVEALPGSGLPELQDLAQRLITELGHAGLMVAVAESCSAGTLANCLSKAEGAGDVLIGGFVTYMPIAKTGLLGVPADLIETHTAVSGPVARAMAGGVLASTPADLALALTGVTGPVADERGNPRGRVCIAAAMKGGEGMDCHCEFGAFPPPVLLDAALRTALAMGSDLLRRHLGSR